MSTVLPEEVILMTKEPEDLDDAIYLVQGLRAKVSRHEKRAENLGRIMGLIYKIEKLEDIGRLPNITKHEWVLMDSKKKWLCILTKNKLDKFIFFKKILTTVSKDPANLSNLIVEMHTILKGVLKNYVERNEVPLKLFDDNSILLKLSKCFDEVSTLYTQ